MSSYYPIIDGKNYDRKMLEIADENLNEQGRLTPEGAAALVRFIGTTGGTDVEKATMRRIRENYKFTPEADAELRKNVNLWRL